MKTKKIIASILAVTMIFMVLLAGCKVNEAIFSVCEDPVKAWAKSYDRSSPDILTVYIEHDGITEAPQVITSAKTTNEVFDALASMRISGTPKKGPVNFDVAPDTVIYHFRSDDGRAVSFTFMDKMLAVGDLNNEKGALYPCSGTETLFKVGGIDLSALNKSGPDDKFIGTIPATSNDGGGEGGGGEQNETKPQVTQPEPAVINLVKYDGGYFSVMLPEGWQIQTMGQYTTFGFRAWDPNSKNFEIFYYGNLSPLLKSHDAKRNWANYINQGGYPNARLYADAPPIDIYDAGSVFHEFQALGALAEKYVPGFSIPMLQNFMIIDTLPLQTPYAPVCTSEALVFASLQGQGGAACHGKFTASIWSTQGYYIGNVDMMPTAALNVTGVIAPQTDFMAVEGILTQAVFSLTFTVEYARQASAHIRETGEAALADNAAKQAIYDAAHDAWDAYIRD
ncbi:MAG: hypothetical protein ACOX1A_05955 [Saccharofermentanales bacterium]|jgi:hypothetical protein|nr:hypothetical protein [Clostridiaceae bacterium]